MLFYRKIQRFKCTILLKKKTLNFPNKERWNSSKKIEMIFFFFEKKVRGKFFLRERILLMDALRSGHLLINYLRKPFYYGKRKKSLTFLPFFLYFFTKVVLKLFKMVLWGRWAQKSITYLYIEPVAQAEDRRSIRGELICVKRDY